MDRKLQDVAPTLKGTATSAWEVTREDMKEGAVRYPDAMGDQFTTCQYVVHAAWAHPFFHHYLITCISLRDMEGFPPADKAFPEATHEISVIVLDPNQDIVLNDKMHRLNPPNFIGQFAAADDESAATRVKYTVREIVQGTLSPDTDFTSEWVKRYGAHCLK